MGRGEISNGLVEGTSGRKEPIQTRCTYAVVVSVPCARGPSGSSDRAVLEKMDGEVAPRAWAARGLRDSRIAARIADCAQNDRFTKMSRRTSLARAIHPVCRFVAVPPSVEVAIAPSPVYPPAQSFSVRCGFAEPSSDDGAVSATSSAREPAVPPGDGRARSW